jgi:hypothetical protein
VRNGNVADLERPAGGLEYRCLHVAQSGTGAGAKQGVGVVIIHDDDPGTAIHFGCL